MVPDPWHLNLFASSQKQKDN